MFYKIVHVLVEILLPPYIQRQIRMTRTTHPYHYIQILTSANYYKYFFPFGNRAVEQPPSLGCPFRRPDLLQVCHLQPLPQYAINQESLFLSAYNFLLLPRTNTIILFILIKIVLYFFYHTFSLTRTAAHNPRERVLQDI